MATLTTERRSGKVAGYNVQWYDGKRRITIHLGGKRYAKKTAERFKDIVEALLFYRRNGITTPEKSVEHWLQNAPVELRAKLAKAELFVVDEAKTCQQLWDAFLKFKAAEVKPTTMKVYRDSAANFFKGFSPDESIDKITPERLLEWKISLLETYAEASVTGYIDKLKSMLNWAVAQDWLAKNPAKSVPSGESTNPENDRIITMVEYAKLLDACPNQEWRVIIALARIGGLRCPSELRQLRWADVDWEGKRFTVHSPKTERYKKHRKRMVPLFRELRVELDKHFSGNENEFVIHGLQGTAWSLHSPFQAISEKAGIGAIIRPFDNMRMSRSNEVDRMFGSKKESLWIGHSERVMIKHYLKLKDEEYASAAEEATC